MNEWMQAHPLVVCGVIGGLGFLLGVMLTLLVLLLVEERRYARCLDRGESVNEGEGVDEEGVKEKEMEMEKMEKTNNQ